MPNVSPWRVDADRILVRLFVVGQPAPSRATLLAAYPFGSRRHYPYRVWLRRLKAWRLAHAQGRAIPPESRRQGKAPPLDGRQLPLFPDRPDLYPIPAAPRPRRRKPPAGPSLVPPSAPR